MVAVDNCKVMEGKACFSVVCIRTSHQRGQLVWHTTTAHDLKPGIIAQFVRALVVVP